jgi:hypothetical protein
MLGRYQGAGMFQILRFTGPLTAEFSSAPDFVFTAANGDKLAVTYGVVANGAAQAGQVTLTPNADGSFTAVFVAEFNPEPAKCTGRFAKITGGSWIMVAVSDPFFITVTGAFYSWIQSPSDASMSSYSGRTLSNRIRRCSLRWPADRSEMAA